MTTKKKKIAIITGTRSEYGILKSLIQDIKKSRVLDAEIFVTGMHLLRSRGSTIKDIGKDGLNVKNKISMYDDNKNKKNKYGLALAEGIKNFTNAFLKSKPDVVIVFGDRLEPLAATLAAVTLKIAVAHIHGGDKTDSGHIDEGIRHAITRFAHLHFVPTKICQERLLRWGEEPARIFLTGALGIDAIMQLTEIKKEGIFKDLKFDIKKKIVIFLFHPVSVEADKAGIYAKVILSVLKEMKLQTVVIYPNNDAGSEDIIAEINKFKNVEYFRFFKSLSSEKYISMLKNCAFIIGNSSSGIIEAPAFGIFTINVGLRNVGREHANNVLYTKADSKQIKKTIIMALNNKSLINKVKKSKNPWGQGGVAKKIVKVLENVQIDDQLMRKKITY